MASTEASDGEGEFTAPAESEPDANASLLRRLQDDDPAAWLEFVARLLPRLRALARREGADPADPICTIDLLTDLLGVWLDGSRRLPDHLDAYVLQAARFCHRQRRRRAESEKRVREAASESGSAAAVSQFSLDQARGILQVEPPTADGTSIDDGALIDRAVRHLHSTLTAEELALMSWHSEGVPRATIAGWLGVSPDVVSKRLQRIRARARILVETEVQSWPLHQQAAWARVWRVLPPTRERAPRRSHPDPEGP